MSFRPRCQRETGHLATRWPASLEVVHFGDVSQIVDVVDIILHVAAHSIAKGHMEVREYAKLRGMVAEVHAIQKASNERAPDARHHLETEDFPACARRSGRTPNELAFCCGERLSAYNEAFTIVRSATMMSTGTPAAVTPWLGGSARR